jgi:hypothetical protein
MTSPRLIVGSMLEEDCRISFLVHPVKAVTMTIAMIDEIDFDKRIYFLTNDEWWHRRDQAPNQLETLSPVATHGLLSGDLAF